MSGSPLKFLELFAERPGEKNLKKLEPSIPAPFQISNNLRETSPLVWLDYAALFTAVVSGLVGLIWFLFWRI